MVPQTSSDQVMVLQIEEIDNSGNVVPGSVITISQPVAGPAPVATPSAVPTHTPPLVTPAPQPTKTPGFAAGAALAALGAMHPPPFPKGSLILENYPVFFSLIQIFIWEPVPP